MIKNSAKKPKILFLCSRSTDYLQDCLYQGLVSQLGKENIKELPFNPYFHFPLRPYPRNLAQQSQGLYSRLKQGLCDFQYDLVLVAAAKPEVFDLYLQLAPKIPSHVPIVFADGGDRAEIGGDLAREGRPELYAQATRLRPFDFILKREYELHAEHAKNVIAMPFAVGQQKLQAALANQVELKYQVTFWAVESDPIRSQVLALIEDQFDCRENGTTRKQIFKKYKRKGDFYLEELRRAKITLNFRGVGWDTLRYWEVPALSRFLISQRPQIYIPNNFREGQEIIYCKDDLSDLHELCQYYLQNDEEREKIAKAAGAWSERYHQPADRAAQLLGLIGYS